MFRSLLSPLHGSRMFQEKYGSNALELRSVSSDVKILDVL